MAKQPFDIDVTDREQLEATLREFARRDGGPDNVVAFAARAALRAVPAFAALDLSSNNDNAANTLLPSFRAMASPWVMAAYPTQEVGDTLSFTARAAANAALAVRAANTASSAANAARAADAAALAADAARAILAADGPNTATNACFAARDAIADKSIIASLAVGVADNSIYYDLFQISNGKPFQHKMLWQPSRPGWAKQGWNELNDYRLAPVGSAMCF